MLLNFDTIGANTDEYNFTRGVPPVQYLDPDQVAQKTATASFGLKDLYTYPEIHDYYNSGDEDLFKVNASAKANLENIYRTEDLFRQGKITDVQQLNQLYQPSGVVERKFANRALGTFNEPSSIGDDEDGTYAEIMKSDPSLGLAIRDISERQTAMIAAMTQARDDLSKRLEKSNEGFFGFINQYGPGRMISEGLGLPEMYRSLTEPSKETKRLELLGMPLNDALAHIDELKKQYLAGDPEAGIQLFSYMLQPDKIAEGHDQFFNMLNIAGYATGVPGVARTMLKARETSRMFKEFESRVVEGVKNPWTVLPSAAGDPKGSAFRRVSAEQVAQMTGNPDPVGEAKSSVMSAFDTAQRDFAAGGPSKNGNASFNIINEQIQRTGVDFSTLVQNAAKVMHVHEALASEGVAEQVLKQAVESHPQLYDHVINAMPFKYNKETNELAVDLIIGTPDGGYYGSADKVISVLEDELGMPVGNVHGWPLPYTGEAPSTGAGVRSIEGVPVQGKPRVTLRNPTAATVPVRDAEGKIIGERDVSQAQKPVMRPGVFSEGKGFYGVVTVPIDQNSKILRDAVVQLPGPRGFVDQILANAVPRLRTPEEVLSEKLMAERKVAMFTPGLFQQLAAKTSAPAAKAKRAETLRFNKAFKRSLENGQKNREWFKDLPELDAYYQRTEGRSPTDIEQQGYFAIKLGRIMEDAYRDLAVTKVMGRHGVERHVFTKYEGGAPPLSKGEAIKSDEVLGSVMNEMPIDHPNARVLIQEGDAFKSRLFRNLNDDDKALVEKVKTGERKGIKLWNSESFPMQDFAGTKDREFIQYVVTDKLETRPLGSFKLPHVDGRLEYDFPHYLKQGDFAYDEDNITHYLGDKTIMALERRAIGVKVAKSLNTARQALLKGDEGIAEAQAAVRDLPIEWSTIRDKFNSGEWDKKADFHVIPSGKSVSDVPGALGDAKNTFRSGSPHNQWARTFTGADDPHNIFAMHSTNIVYNPGLSFRQAEFLDPYVSMNRSLSRLINSTYMEDVKFNSISDWMTRYGAKLNWGEYARQDNPYQAFVHAELDKTLPAYERGQIEAERAMIKSFSSIPSTQESWVHTVEQWLADKSFTGDSATVRGTALLSKFSFDGAAKLPSILRAFAYRFGLGLFNPAQFFTQLNTYTTIYGLGGARAAGKGAMGALLHTVSNLPVVGKQALADLDKMATRFGFRPGEWMEARQHMLDTGFHLVSKETNELRASMYPDKLFKSTTGMIFDAGDVFFNGGEKFSRYGAWYATWDMKAANLSRMDPVTRQSILQHADMMTGNMTKASRSALQEGLGALPSQFLGYWLRTAELFTGSRLSTAQKLRMFSAYSVLYGLPSGLALTGVGGLLTNTPMEQWLTKAAVDRGFLPENSRISQTFFQGLVSAMVSAATGRDYSLGTKFGIGPGRGLDIWTEDKSIWQILTGPVGDMVGQTVGNSEPLVRIGWGAISGNDARRHLTPDDWRRPLSVINTYSTASKLWYALKYHEWQSKNENPILSNVSNSEAWMMAMLGIQPEAANRLAMVRSSGKWVADEIDRLTEQAKLDQQRYFRAVTNHEDSTALEHWRNLNVTMDQIPQEMKASVWASITQANRRSVPDSATHNYFMGNHKLRDQDSDLTKTYLNSVQQIMGK